MPDKTKLQLEQPSICVKVLFFCPDSVFNAAGKRPVGVKWKLLVSLFMPETVGVESLILGARACFNFLPLPKS